MSWQPGSDRIAELVSGGELSQVAADPATADRLLADARRHLDSASAARDLGDLAGAYQLAYDALRKSAAALLAAQGLRATSKGGHVAVQDAVRAQFEPTVRAFRSFSRIRRTRHSFEYPDSDTAGPAEADVTDAIAVATDAHRAASVIFEQRVLGPWSGRASESHSDPST